MGASLLTAYYNAGGKIGPKGKSLGEALREIQTRGGKLPGSICGHWGVCGAAISAGMYMAIVTGSNPMKSTEWGLANSVAGQIQTALGYHGEQSHEEGRKHMKQIVRKVLIVVLLLVFLGSGGVFLWKQMDYRNGAQNYEEAAQLAQVERREETEPEAASGETIDLEALQQVNDQVIGWLTIPDTEISYPLMLGEDNDYYLNHTWDGTRSSVGAIFVDYRNSQALDDFNTIIYGHKMNNDAMFGLLHEYKNEGFLEAHPSLYITDGAGERRYDIFAYYETATTNTYRRDFADDGEKKAYIDECLAQRWVDNGIQPGVEDHIITLSTCTGNGHATRWVVQAVQIPF